MICSTHRLKIQRTGSPYAYKWEHSALKDGLKLHQYEKVLDLKTRTKSGKVIMMSKIYCNIINLIS